jgi:pimeloyl-ACP methyl ester carboxylesterase
MSAATAFFVACGSLLSTPGEIPQGVTSSATFDSSGVRIRYLTAGQGEPVILLHGWIGEASHWGPGNRENPRLNAATGYQVIAPDLRGHGMSDKPTDPAAYGREMAKDVVRLMDHLKLKKAHLVGYSMGSFVAGNVVEQAPSRVLSVVYGGGNPIMRNRAVKGFSDAEAFAKAVDEGQLGKYLRERTPGLSKLSDEQAEKMATRTYAHQDVKALAACGRAFGAMEVDERKMGSAAESPFVLARIREAQSAMPFAKTEVIAGANHITALAHPRFGTAVVEFIGQNRAR